LFFEGSDQVGSIKIPIVLTDIATPNQKLPEKIVWCTKI
jgi:hypothetical protein